MVIPTHNRSAFLKEALASVCAQTLTDWECLVVDDGSSDDTASVVSALAAVDRRVRYACQEASGTPSSPRNRGIRETSAPLVSFLDDDDIWLPGKLALQVELLDTEPDVAFTFGQVRQFGAEKNIWPDLRLPDRPSFDQLLAENFVPLSTVMVRRSVVESVGMFNEELSIAEDYELWLRLALQAPMRAVPDILCRYRVHPGGVTRTSTKELDVMEGIYDRFQREHQIAARRLRPGRRGVHLRRARQARGLWAKLPHYWRAVTP